ncbi:hypothetical protein G6F57_018056 [Rhizopus arrhizus]|nr:hypothetical protein G6F57_018056 [Rhizopus arrhizus]
MTSKLEDIPGIGPRRRASLLKHFGGLVGLKAAGEAEIAKVEGINDALAALDPPHLADVVADRDDPGAGAGVLPALHLDQLRFGGDLRPGRDHRLARWLDCPPLPAGIGVRRLPRPGRGQADGGGGAVPDRAGPPDAVDGVLGGGDRRP